MERTIYECGKCGSFHDPRDLAREGEDREALEAESWLRQRHHLPESVEAVCHILHSDTMPALFRDNIAVVFRREDGTVFSCITSWDEVNDCAQATTPAR